MKYKCIVLYTFDFNRMQTKELYEMLKNYFQDKLGIKFKFVDHWDESYKTQYMSIERFEDKARNFKWAETVHFALDDEQLEKKPRNLSVEFNFSRPHSVCIFASINYQIEVADLIKQLSLNYHLLYGFCYFFDKDFIPLEYALGGYQHLKKIPNVERISREDILRWSNNCEKIKDGFIRDIYNENVLHELALYKPVNGGTLSDYIVNNGIGQLIHVLDKLYLWKLTDAELKSAKKILYKSSLVI